jgi:hypothetical protein
MAYGKRIITFRIHTFQAMMDKLTSIAGATVSKTLFYQMGEEIGQKAMEYSKPEIQSPSDLVRVADTKHTADITPMFAEGKKLAGKAPSTLITDGAFNFNSAFRKAFWRENKALAIRHERHVRFQGDLNNQKMERMNGEIRDREKVVRGIKKPESPLIEGYQIYHNYIRPHMALDNQTPAQKAGIKVQGQNKWMTLIQNASTKARIRSASSN